MQQNRFKFSKEEVEDFANYFNTGYSIKKTAEHFNVKYREVLHYLIYFGYYTPKRKQSNVTNYCVNETFFENIDTQDKAYFLGLLMSDGYIITTLYNKEVGLALKAEDKYILDKLNNYISPNKKVSQYKNSYKWKVISPKIYEDLKKYGIVENKSTTEYHYPNIPKEYDKDFIRGYFDGDGCISIKSSGYNVISFCGNSKLFLEDLSKVLLNYGIQTRPIYSTNINRKNIFHTLYLTGGINKSIFKQFLYNDAETYLNRKYEKFMKIPC